MVYTQTESVLENEMNKILGAFEIRTNHQILAGKSDLVLFNKKKICHRMDFAIPIDSWVKINESEKIRKYFDLVRELKKAEEHESDGDTNYSLSLWRRIWRLDETCCHPNFNE